MHTVGRLRRLLNVFAGLLLSGAALVALGYIEGVPARAAAVRNARIVGAADLPLPKARKTGAAVTAEGKTAVPADPTTKTSAAGVNAATVAAVMPDFVGKRYGQARREAKALGIKVSARDEYGERVPADVAHLYLVKTQSVAPGTALAASGKLTFRVREPEGYAMGY